MKALLDTNILLDYLFEREPFVEDAARIFELIDMRIIEGFISVQSLKDVFYLCKKSYGKNDPFFAIEKLSYFCKILDVNADDSMNDFSDYEDGLLAFSAKRNGVDVIITRNENDFYESNIPIINPREIEKCIGNNTNSTSEGALQNDDRNGKITVGFIDMDHPGRMNL